MIDIAQVVQGIVKVRNASDEKAYTKHTHALVRQYGQELLLNLAAAILPTTAGEQECVAWLKDQVAKVANQIPEAKE